MALLWYASRMRNTQFSAMSVMLNFNDEGFHNNEMFIRESVWSVHLESWVLTAKGLNY